MSTISGTITHGITLGAPNYGSPLTITSAGAISSSGSGILGTYAGTLVNAGSVYGHQTGIELDDGGSVTNQFGGTISSYFDGILVTAGYATVVNAGLISGRESLGVDLVAGGNLTNLSSGTISSYSNTDVTAIGIYTSGGTVVNAGSVYGTFYGIQQRAGGSLTNVSGGRISGFEAIGFGSSNGSLVNAGTVSGVSDGVFLNSGLVINQSGGTITGDQDGILFDGPAGTVVNAGLVSGGEYYGVEDRGGNLTNQAGGTISGDRVGIYSYVYGTGAPTIVNAGVIIGATGIRFRIRGDGTAAQTVVDSGTIIGTGGSAIAFDGGDDLLEFVPGYAAITGVVDGGGAATLEFASGAGVGTLTGSNADFTNFAIGTVDAGASWVLAGTVTFGIGITLADNSGFALAASGTLVNAGSITADLTSYSIRGGGAAALLRNLGSIQAYNIAVSLQSGGTIINGASGNTTALISANYGAFVASGLVSNYGTISASGGGSESVLLAGAGQVSNHAGGLITGHNVGVDLSGGVATLTNLGVISATNNGVLALYGSDVVMNGAGALISGSRAVAFVATATTLVSDTLENYGTITGQYGVLDGVLQSIGTLQATILDAGTIIGTGGTAIGVVVSSESASVDLTLRLLVGNDFIQGAVVGETNGIGVLDFASGAGTGTLTGSGADFTNFQTASVDAGADWVLAGTNTLGASVSLVNAGTLTNSGELIDSGALTNNGTIIGTGSGRATHVMTLTAGATLINLAGGTITSGAGSALYRDDQSSAESTITNFGTISGSGGDGVYFFGGEGIITNTASAGANASITGSLYGVKLSGVLAPNVVTNTGGTNAIALISGGKTGVDIITYGTLHNTDGTISGGTMGVYLGPGSGTLVNQGDGAVAALITGGAIGVWAGITGPTTIANTGGTIIGGSEYGIVLDGDAGTVTNTSVTNADALIQGGKDGIYVSGTGYNSIVNDGGTIIGLTHDGVDGFEGAFVTNTGTGALISGANVGVFINPGLSSHESVVNYGTIIGAIGVETGSYATVVDAGTIIGTAGTAVWLAQPFDALRFVPGNALIQGKVLGFNLGEDTGLEFASGTATGTLTGVGAYFQDISLGTVDAGANWVLAGNNTFGTGVTLTNSGVLTDIGTLVELGTIINAVTLGATAALISIGSTGAISGPSYGIVGTAAGTVVNAGSVYGGTVGIYLGTGGSVTNQSGGTIMGAGAAVTVRAGYAATVAVDPGARFIGSVDGGNAIGSAIVSTLELASGASSGTLTGIGSQFTNFGSIVFDPDAAWLLSGNSAGVAENSGGLGPVVSGFAVGDTIDLTGFNAASDSFANHGLVLSNSTGADVTIDFAGNYAGNAFQISSDGSGGTDIVIACFLPGTHILTDHGEIEVEKLQLGDTIVTASGGARRLCWIGQGKALTARGRRGPATPLIVRKGALADNIPHRDLRVTKGHSLYLDGVLIPVEFLVNHRSILWDDHAQEVTVYHLELDRHDVLLAEGAAAESYRDDGNRWLFQNANPGWEQPAQPPCAPVLTGGKVVDAAWRRLLDRSGPSAPLPLTDDPDLHLLADGQLVEATSRLPGVAIFSLESVPSVVRILSRRVVPQELGLARDARELGVALRSVLVRKGTKFRVAKARDPRLVSGFHPYEAADDLIWTDGDATIPADLLSGFSGRVEVVLTLAGATQYVDDGVRRRVA
ncbi:MAG TPA: Hint domain-containing protein [Rhodopila sp.]